jgi:hypothetical protein
MVAKARSYLRVPLQNWQFTTCERYILEMLHMTSELFKSVVEKAMDDKYSIQPCSNPTCRKDTHTDLQLRLAGPSKVSKLNDKTRNRGNGNIDSSESSPTKMPRASVHPRRHVFCGPFGRQVWSVICSTVPYHRIKNGECLTLGSNNTRADDLQRRKVRGSEKLRIYKLCLQWFLPFPNCVTVSTSTFVKSH